MKLRKWLSLGITLLAVALVARIGLVSPLQIISEAGEPPQYISEVKTFCASSVSEAKKKASKEGFTPVDGNLNDGTGYDAVVLGYKTTEDRDAAITDISMAQMKSGYKMVSYGDVAQKQVEKLDGVGAELLTAVKEFAANYKNGSPAAASAYRILNYYKTDVEGAPLLGDYFLSGSCTKDYLLKILSRANSAVVNTVYNALVAGTADYGDSTWAQRIADSDIRRAADENNCGKEEDALYKEYALKLYAGVQDFATKYEDAAARAAVAKTDSLMEAEQGEVCDIPEDTLEDIEDGNKLNEQEGDAFYIAAYEALNAYRYNEETLLGDYIVNAGKLTFSTTAELRVLYPFVEALTNGQAAIMRMTGLASFVFYLDNSASLLETGEEYFEEIDGKIADYNGASALSVWVGTDQTIYEKKVALTDELERYSQAGKSYSDLTKEDQVSAELNELMSLVSFVSLVVSIAYSVTVLGANAVGYLASFAVWAGTATTWTVCVSAIGSGVLGTILGVLGCVAIVASYLVLAAMVIIVLAMFVNWVIHLFDDEDEEYTEIPVVFYDLFGSSCVKYSLVPSSSSVADLNAGEGKRWNALYYSTDTALGEPLTVDGVGRAFTVAYNDNATPSGYAPVKNFGEVVAANLNANVRESDARAVYLFYHNGAAGSVVNEGEPTDETEGEKTEKTRYLSKLTLSTEKTEAAAKAALVKRDYIVLDVDLSPMAEQHTYLGYMTTTDKTKAITDIRISAKNSQSPFIFGEASYTHCGTTPTGDGLYYTSYACAGTPVLADLQVADSFANAKKGFEPVNLFCGGNAYNFNNGDNSDDDAATEYDHFKDVKRLLYFHPSVTYTEGQEYVAGVVLVAGSKAADNKKNLEQYIKELGLQKFDNNLTKGLEVKQSSSFSNGTMLWSFDKLETYFCYSTTYNPYRAITDMRTYTAQPTNTQVFANFGTIETGGFAVCDVYYQLPEQAQANEDEDEYYRGIYGNHSYMDCTGADAVRHFDDGEMAPEDFETVSWSSSNVRAKGLYVCGPMTGKTPLRVEDMYLSNETTAKEGFVSVQDARTPNGTAAHNIAFFKEDGDCQKTYLYLRKTVAQKEYIASVHVVSYHIKDIFTEKELEELEDEQKEAIDKTAEDMCIRRLLSTCEDEILNINVASNASDTYRGDPENFTSRCSYIGVTRTTDSSKAVTGLIKYRGKTALPEMTVGGVTYTKCGDKIDDKNGGYWLYSAVSSGAVPGEPITAITLDNTPIVAGAATVLNAKAADTDSEKASLYGATGDVYYIHTCFEEKSTHVSALYLGHGKTKNEALCNLLTQGCCMALDRNLNENAGGEYIYLGYSKYTPKTSDRNAKFAVRDILLTVNQPFAEEITADGVTYLAAASDCENGLSLNRGTDGDTVYLYYTTYFASGSKAVLTKSPILKIGSAIRDRVPDSEDAYAWENVFTTEGRRANLNAGVVSSDDGGVTMKDCRVYLFVNRMDNSVVPARKITGGHCAELVDYGKATIDT